MPGQIRNTVALVLLSAPAVAGGECEIPGYPEPKDIANLGLSWCPAAVNYQVRVFALQAAGAQCALATGSSSTPDQIQARRQEIETACERLASFRVSNCQCPPGFPSVAQRPSEIRTGASLPPEMMADRYLLQAEDLIAQKAYLAALNKMDQIRDLQKEHQITLPEGFHFQYARGAMRSGSLQAATAAATRYLAVAGRDGEFYRDALKLLNQVESIQTRLDQYPVRIGQLTVAKDYASALALMDEMIALQKEYNFTLPEDFHSKHAQVRIARQPCTGQPKGAQCWVEFANQPGCYFWAMNFEPQMDITWTGGCVDGLAQGTGTVVQQWKNGKNGGEIKGSFQAGRIHGRGVIRYPSGRVDEGSYVEGKQHGRWVFRHPDGTVNEGPYVEGKQTGRWIARDRSGRVIAEAHFVDGEGEWVKK